ncbi:MAG: hypothetical protein NWF12_02555 [Candidatus Bathyarchaeota archaeon]|nr:hypothetical protein [Candidatus Bathyarchaeota archaeon]
MDARELERVMGVEFRIKPLLVGGGAMEHYGLREKGDDIDFVVSDEDYREAVARNPDHGKDIFGDLGVVKEGFEVWRTIMLFDYDFLSQGAVDQGDHLVISLEKLLFLKALAIKEPKYEEDLRLIVDRIIKDQYKDHME